MGKLERILSVIGTFSLQASPRHVVGYIAGRGTAGHPVTTEIERVKYRVK